MALLKTQTTLPQSKKICILWICQRRRLIVPVVYYNFIRSSSNTGICLVIYSELFCAKLLAQIWLY